MVPVGIIIFAGLTRCQRADKTASPGSTASAKLAQPPSRAPTGEAPVPELVVRAMSEESKIIIDGKLDELAWQQASTTGDFVNPGTGSAAGDSNLAGRALLTWNQQALYVAFVIRDTDIHGNFAPDASDPHLWTQSTAEIMIDPDGNGDNRDYYEIQIGPQNLVFDSQFDDYNQPRVLPDGPYGHQDWTARLTSAVVIRGTLNQSGDRDDGYTVEAQIPWASFTKAKSAPPGSGDRWRMNFYAMRSNGGVSWSPILGRGNFHKASRFGGVTWLRTPKGR